MPAPESLAADLRRRIRKAQAEKRLPGVSAAAVCDGELVWAEAVGLADVESGEEATADHQYRIASITKTFTAVAVMQLRDAGGLSLEDRLDRHVPGAVRSPTLRSLLTHASGLQREPPGRIWETLEFPSRDELVAGLGEAEQLLAPGSYQHYSNLAFSLLGEVVARVSGTEYERYVDERILKPLGLERTTWKPVAPAAAGYFVEPWSDGVSREPVSEGRATASAGELWSTAPDLCRWAAFLADPDPDVLAPDTVEEMHAFQAMADPDHWTQGFGLGLMLMRRDDRIFSGHSGAHLGFLSIVAVDRRQRTGAAVLTNAQSGVAITALGVDLAAAVSGSLAADPAEWRPGEAVPPELEDVLGSWWSEGNEFVFRFFGGRLEAAERDGPPGRDLTRFEREAEDRYRAVSGPERGELLRLVRDDAGRVARMYFASYPFTRTPEPIARERA